MLLFWCIHCRAMREGKDHEVVYLRNGRKAYKAICLVCGRAVYKLVAKNKAV